MNYLIPINFIPFLMILFGAIFLKHGPKNINSFIGYRTTMSQKNKDTWQFAQHYCGKVLLITGIITSIVFSILSIIFHNINNSYLDYFSSAATILQCIVLIASIFITERALKKNFDKNGAKIL